MHDPFDLLSAIEDDMFFDVLHGDGSESASNSDPHWKPYGSHTMCVLNAIDRLPHLPISDSLMKIILWGMKQCGTPRAPSFYALRKLQRELRITQGVPTIECKSVQNNVFFMNDPRSIIAQVHSYLFSSHGSHDALRTGLIQTFNLTSMYILKFPRMELSVRFGMLKSGAET